MIIYYSGVGYGYANPEVLLGDKSNIMLTFHDFAKKGEPDSRFRKIIEKRPKKGAKK